MSCLRVCVSCLSVFVVLGVGGWGVSCLSTWCLDACVSCLGVFGVWICVVSGWVLLCMLCGYVCHLSVCLMSGSLSCLGVCALSVYLPLCRSCLDVRVSCVCVCVCVCVMSGCVSCLDMCFRVSWCVSC